VGPKVRAGAEGRKTIPQDRLSGKSSMNGWMHACMKCVHAYIKTAAVTDSCHIHPDIIHVRTDYLKAIS